MTENVTLGWRLMKLQEKVSKLQKKMTPHCPITSGSVYVAEHICETYEKIAYLLEDITGLQWDIRSAERALAASFRNLTAAQARYTAVTGKSLPRWAVMNKTIRKGLDS